MVPEALRGRAGGRTQQSIADAKNKANALIVSAGMSDAPKAEGEALMQYK